MQLRSDDLRQPIQSAIQLIHCPSCQRYLVRAEAVGELEMACPRCKARFIGVLKAQSEVEYQVLQAGDPQRIHKK